ncbi:Alpha/Beta hydrolase protein [Dichotomopilus funicola]|uniref:Alpha/Beta hydrolase protein n=1 Tax=Dichotomopilus funicola TaxID=1934379 RepID=A0AAN6UXC3_9PEZI|nr:Alpha/Beta hydrolase protein [Dichotomopilus funicola]
MPGPTKVTFTSFMLQISGELHPPAAVVISHPMTGVKEQTATTHARLLSKAGFYALTLDAGYQGESTGQPRGLEDPHKRVEDNKAAGGYTSIAAQSDSRIKALATVSTACVGRMTRNGGLSKENKKEVPDAIAGALDAAGQWRTSLARDPKIKVPPMFGTDISQIPEDVDSFFKDAALYYGSERGNHPRSDQKVPPSSFDLVVSYDSFNFQHLISPRPLLMIAGSKAQTLHYSEGAAREPRELLVIDGKSHFDLYDDLEVSGPRLVDFLSKNL